LDEAHLTAAFPEGLVLRVEHGYGYVEELVIPPILHVVLVDLQLVQGCGRGMSLCGVEAAPKLKRLDCYGGPYLPRSKEVCIPKVFERNRWSGYVTNSREVEGPPI
jgi:hypothetical protein